MDKKVLKEYLKDSHITYNFYIDEISALKCIPDKMDNIIICCHGIASNKKYILYYYKTLLEHNIGLISFDFPCHGDSISKKNDFNLKKCIEYLDKVYNYTINTYPNTKISLMGSSFGGYVILNKIKNDNNFYKIILNYPAVNFMEAFERELKINEHYFDKRKVLGPLYGIRMYKDAYFEFKQNDVMKNFIKIKDNIYIIHGESDSKVYLKDVVSFKTKYNIPLIVVKGGTHGLKENNKEVIDFILNCLKGA